LTHSHKVKIYLFTNLSACQLKDVDNTGIVELSHYKLSAMVADFSPRQRDNATTRQSQRDKSHKPTWQSDMKILSRWRVTFVTLVLWRVLESILHIYRLSFWKSYEPKVTRQPDKAIWKSCLVGALSRWHPVTFSRSYYMYI